MKLLDDKKRLFGIVNPVDLVAILLAVVAVLVLAQVLFGKSPTAPVTGVNRGTVEVVLTGSLDNYAELQYELGQEVNRAGGVGSMGTLESFELKPLLREVFLDDGTVIEVPTKTAQQVTMVVRGEGEITDNGASIGAERIRQNQVIEAQLPHLQLSVRVASITQVD